ncbi:MAG TPA: Rrf2 family transcriptional regulator [Aestuariivirga sp.]
MISQRARYAFKAVVALARAKPGVGLQIRELCEQEKLPRKFLEQILLLLKAAGYISSRRGRDGGYELLKPTDLIYIGPMLRAVDGPIAPLSCLSRTAYRRCADCKDETHCELRIAFAQAYAVYLAALENTSLAQIMRQSDATELPLGDGLLAPTTA